MEGHAIKGWRRSTPGILLAAVPSAGGRVVCCEGRSEVRVRVGDAAFFSDLSAAIPGEPGPSYCRRRASVGALKPTTVLD